MASWADRYVEAGLRANPFATTWSDERTDGLVDRGLGPAPVPAQRTLVQVVGERGFGKTTQLRQWRRQAPAPQQPAPDHPAPYHYVVRVPYRQRWVPPPVAPLVFADEVDRLPGPRRWRWFRALARVGATAVVGTHRDLGHHARRAGLTVVTHWLDPISSDDLARIVGARLGAAALDPTRPPQLVSRADVAAVHARSGGSIRAAEVLCHGLVAERVAKAASR
jgi:hypothetical protein